MILVKHEKCETKIKNMALSFTFNLRRFTSHVCRFTFIYTIANNFLNIST